MYSGEYIKAYREQANRQTFRVWNSHYQYMLHGYSRQRRTIGSFPAPAELI